MSLCNLGEEFSRCGALLVRVSTIIVWLCKEAHNYKGHSLSFLAQNEMGLSKVTHKPIQFN